MNKKELRAKKSLIRKEIKERMQNELDERKKEIKRRIRREDISVEEKREKYRSEVHREKIRLMDMAKSEFRARKNMLGEADEDSLGEIAQEDAPYKGVAQDAADPSDEALQWELEEQMLVGESEEREESSDHVDPEGAFVFDDDSTEEREALREFESPIGEYDALPPESARWEGDAGLATGAKAEIVESKSIFYFITGLVLHPIQTLDEFDDYLAAPGGLMKVAIFYFASLMPLALFMLVTENSGVRMPGGLSGAIIGSMMPRDPSILLALGKMVMNLFLLTLSLAIVNYFFTDEANFVTLLTYFAFVEGTTNAVVYSLVIGTVLAVVIAPQFIGLVILLFIAMILWRVALNAIVLMCAYGYGIFSAILLIIGAGVLQRIASIFIAGLLGASFEEALYPD